MVVLKDSAAIIYIRIPDNHSLHQRERAEGSPTNDHLIFLPFPGINIVHSGIPLRENRIFNRQINVVEWVLILNRELFVFPVISGLLIMECRPITQDKITIAEFRGTNICKPLIGLKIKRLPTHASGGRPPRSIFLRTNNRSVSRCHHHRECRGRHYDGKQINHPDTKFTSMPAAR